MIQLQFTFKHYVLGIVYGSIYSAPPHPPQRRRNVNKVHLRAQTLLDFPGLFSGTVKSGLCTCKLQRCSCRACVRGVAWRLLSLSPRLPKPAAVDETDTSGPRGLMDKALASGARDCGFESHRGRNVFSRITSQKRIPYLIVPKNEISRAWWHCRMEIRRVIRKPNLSEYFLSICVVF